MGAGAAAAARGEEEEGRHVVYELPNIDTKLINDVTHTHTHTQKIQAVLKLEKSIK